MTCAKCKLPFRGGTFRVHYRAGWLCRVCYNSLALAPVGARCVYCKEKIAIDDWKYKLWDVTGSSNDLQRLYVHQDCEGAMSALQRVA